MTLKNSYSNLNFEFEPRDHLQICDLLDVLILLLETPGHGDQLHLLMFEPKMGESLFYLLTVDDYTSQLKERVLKVTATHLFILLVLIFSLSVSSGIYGTQ